MITYWMPDTTFCAIHKIYPPGALFTTVPSEMNGMVFITTCKYISLEEAFLSRWKQQSPMGDVTIKWHEIMGQEDESS